MIDIRFYGMSAITEEERAVARIAAERIVDAMNIILRAGHLPYRLIHGFTVTDEDSDSLTVTFYKDYRHTSNS